MSEPAVIRTDSVSVRYRRTLAVDSVTLDVPRGSVRLVTGSTGRQKVVGVAADGAVESVRRRWPGVAVG